MCETLLSSVIVFLFPNFIAAASHCVLATARASRLSTIISSHECHHSVILFFQHQNFPFSQIIPSIVIWHLFGLIL